MTSRERILRVLKGEMPDRIPWTPLLDPYYFSSLKEPLNQFDAVRAFGGDIFARHIAVLREALQTTVQTDENGNVTIRQECAKGDIEIVTRKEKGFLTETSTTPIGVLQSKWVYNEHATYIPFPVEHKLKTAKDIGILKHICENIDFEPCYDVFDAADAEIGDDGIATATAPGTPFHDLLEGDFGIEKCYYMLYDFEYEMEELMETMHEQRKKAYGIIAKSPAQVVIGYENTSTTTMSPGMYEKYCERQINEYAEIMHKSGKIFLTHMCGKLKGLEKQLSRGQMDGIVDIAPEPTGDVSLGEARRMWVPGKIVMGGIDATQFKSLTPDEMTQYVKCVLMDIAPGSGVFLGSGDATPKGTPLENLQAITDAVNRYGRF